MNSVTGVQLSNPYLSYRLDPGEPGLLRQAPASKSAIMVTAQERRNLTRLVSAAYQDGRIPIQSGISYSVGFAGSYMAVKGGHTTVVSVKDRVPAFIEVDTKPPEKIGIQPEPASMRDIPIQDTEIPVPTTKVPEPGEITVKDLEREENALIVRMALQRNQLEDAQRSGGGELTGRAEFAAEQAIREIDKRLSQIQFQKFLKETEEMSYYPASAGNVDTVA